MAKRKAKPSSPADIARRNAAQRASNFAAVGMQPEASNLVANATVVVEREGRENVQRARRMDAFEALRKDMPPGAYDAARRLERDIIISRGEHDAGRSLERVGDEAMFCRTDAIIRAAERVRKVFGFVGLRDVWLLSELIAPLEATKLRCQTWRDVVAYVTGEQNASAQCSAVRASVHNLALAYKSLDRCSSLSDGEIEVVANVRLLTD